MLRAVRAVTRFNSAPRRYFSNVPGWTPIPSVGRLNHVAVAVPNLESSMQFYREVLGGQVSPKQELPDHGVTVSFVDLGNTKIELLHPLGASSPIAKFLEKNKNGGMHHICMEVDDIHVSLKHLESKGIKPLGPPSIGSHGKLVVFLHPKDCGGVLTELEEVNYPKK